MGDIFKLLLVKLIRLLIANAGVAALVIVVVKIVGHAGLRVGQVGKNRPVAGFELLGFEARPPAFRLGVVVALAAPAVRELGPGVAQQGLVGVAYVLPALPGTTPVGMDNEAGSGPLGRTR